MGGCKKDPPIPTDPNCLDLNFGGCAISLNVIYYDSTQFKAPSINPNNQNEFVYLYSNNNSASLNGLYKYSLATLTKQQLTTGLNIFNQPKWGKNGWVLFNVINGDYREIYKIKSNGDSLTKLTSLHPDIFPEWNSDGTKIIFNRAGYLAAPASKIFVADNAGNLLDSINSQYFFYGACSKNNELAYPPFSRRNFGITLFNLPSKSETTLYNPSEEKMIQGITWHPNGDDIYFTTFYGGLYSLNRTSKQLNLIKSFCGSKAYNFISVSPDASFLLVERIDGRVVNCSPHYKSTIFKVSIDGKTEAKIVLE